MCRCACEWFCHSKTLNLCTVDCFITLLCNQTCMNLIPAVQPWFILGLHCIFDQLFCLTNLIIATLFKSSNILKHHVCNILVPKLFTSKIEVYYWVYCKDPVKVSLRSWTTALVPTIVHYVLCLNAKHWIFVKSRS